MGEIHKGLENPWVIGSGYYLRRDFEDWVDVVTEIRFSRFVQVEQILDAMQHMLQKFQPLVYKIRDVYKEYGETQRAVNKMISMVRKEIPKLEAKSEVRTVIAQGSAKGGEKGKHSYNVSNRSIESICRGRLLEQRETIFRSCV